MKDLKLIKVFRKGISRLYYPIVFYYYATITRLLTFPPIHTKFLSLSDVESRHLFRTYEFFERFF